jgi:hypothetical protein
MTGNAARQLTIVVESVHSAAGASGIGSAASSSFPIATIALTGVAQTPIESAIPAGVTLLSRTCPSGDDMMLNGTPDTGMPDVPTREPVTVKVSTLPVVISTVESARTNRRVTTARVDTVSTRESPASVMTAALRIS